MKFALDTCIHGEYSNPVLIAELASLAEKAGWDGFFIWDGIGGSEATADPWVTLSLIASCTSKIRIGTAVTPIARRRPWKLARETTSVDWISQGRLTLGVGLGDPPSTEYQQFGENSTIRTLADKLDEGLEVLTGLWTGKEFSYKGIHFNIDQATFLPIPVQSPRIPIWIGANWPNKRPLRRAAKWDGVYPIYWNQDKNEMSPDILRKIVSYISEYRDVSKDFDVVAAGTHDILTKTKLIELSESYKSVGATWYAAPIGSHIGGIEDVKEWIELGPPRL